LTSTTSQPCLAVLPSAVALDPRFQRQPLPQQSDGIVGLKFLPEADAGIDEQHRQNDDKVGPMAEHGRKRRGNLDHPRDWAPEIAEQLVQRTDMRLLQRVFAVLGEQAPSIRARKARRLSRTGAASGGTMGVLQCSHRRRPQTDFVYQCRLR
jgi:hypothetical protein